MKRFAVTSLFLLSAFVLQAQAFFVSNSLLTQWISDAQATFMNSGDTTSMDNSMKLAGYIQGVADVFESSHIVNVPRNTTVRSMFNVLSAYMSSHSVAPDGDGVFTLAQAFVAAYPVPATASPTE